MGFGLFFILITFQLLKVESFLVVTLSPRFLFRQQLTGDSDPDLVLLSVVTGFVENCMTNPKNITVLVDNSSKQLYYTYVVLSE